MLRWAHLGSNQGPPACEAGALPLSYAPGRKVRLARQEFARGQCRQPYNITRGPSGGVVMHLPDQSQPTELLLKGGPDGKNYIGLAEEPAGGQRDREIVAFDGRVLITRFTDPEVSGRYGTSVYVRCGAETAPGARKAAPKAAKKS